MMRRFIRILLYLLTFAVVAGGGGLLWHLREQRVLFYTDADTIRRPVEETATRDVLWTPPVAIDGAVNSPVGEYGPRVTSDGLVMYLVRGRAGADADILVSLRTTDGWSEPAPLDVVNTRADELNPEPSRDGRSIYFASNRAGGVGGYDLWVVHRDDARESGWGEPVNLGAGVNTVYHEYGPALAPGDDAIWFASNRPGAGDTAIPGADESVILREDLYDGDFDLYRAALNDGAPDGAEAVDLLNSPAQEGAPALSPAGDFVYFASDRDGGHGGFDIYRARLAPELLAPSNLLPPLNTAADEIDPGVSVAGFGLHFSSNRGETDAVAHSDTHTDADTHADTDAGADTGADTDAGAHTVATAPDHDLYFASSREVYTATEVVRATIDWLAVLPYVLWIIIALLLLALIWSFGRVLASERYRTLGLLARCLIASVIVHALLLVGLTFWGVGNSLSDWVAERGTRVAIVSPSIGSDLAAQVRGTVTDVSMEAQVVQAEQNETTVAPPKAEGTPTELSVAETAIETHDPAPAAEARDAPGTTPALPERADPAAVEPMSNLALALEIEASPVPAASAETDVAIATPTGTPTPEQRTTDMTPAPVDPVRTEAAPSPTAAMAGAQTIVGTYGARDARPEAPPAPSRTTVAPRPAGITTDLPAVPEAAAASATEASSTVAALTPGLQRSPATTPGPAPSAAPTRIDVDLPSSAAAAPATSLAGTGDVATTTGAPDVMPADLAASSLRPPAPTVAAASLALDLPSPTDAAAARGEDEAVLSVDADRIAATATSAAPRAATNMAPSASPTEIVRTSPRGASLAPAHAAGLLVEASAPLAPSGNGPALEAPRPRRPEHGPATSLAFDLPAPSADMPPPATESTVVVDPDDIVAPLARTATTSSADVAAEILLVHADTSGSSAGTALDARFAAAAAATFAIDAPPPIDLPALENRRLPVAPRRELELEIPVDEMIAPTPHRQRAPEARVRIVKEMGGNEATERAVEMSLDWLARHQSADGRWDSDGYDDGCHECAGATRVDVDIALTGLSMLCFLATDNTHMKDGRYRDTMERAVRWLVNQQGRDGDLLGDESMYSHGIATIALAEAYGMTGDPAIKEAVQDAVRFIVDARNRRGGGWRYAPGQAGDTSVMGWQMMALKSARNAGLDVDPAGFGSVRRWLESIERLSPPGLYVYQPGRPHSPAMTAEGLFVQQLLGSDPDLVEMDASVEYILAHPPRWDLDANTYYWYYATLALFQHQGDAWRRWNDQVRDQLVEHQVKSGGAAGSWPTADQWSRTGGRIYQTAICTLTLQVYYRYLPAFVRTAKRD